MEISTIAAQTDASRNRGSNGATMQWMILEALVALALGLLILVLALSSARRREPGNERREAGSDERNNAGKDVN